MSIAIYVLRIDYMTNISDNGIMNNTFGIIEDKRDVEGIRVNQNAQDNNNHDMDNRFPGKILWLDSPWWQLMGSFLVIRYFCL